MKKTFVIIAAVLLTTTAQIFAQKNSFKTAPIDLLAERYGATYERSVKENLSVLFTFKKINATNDTEQIGEILFPLLTALGGTTTTRTRGFITEFSLRKYIGGKNGMSGLYFQPGLALGKTTITATHSKGWLDFSSSEVAPPQTKNRSLNAFSYRMGYQWVTTGGFSLDLGLGGNSYLVPTGNKKGNLLFNCKLGFAF